MSTYVRASKRGLLLWLCLLLAGCQMTASPPPERDFGVADLFLPLDVFPENWQEVGEIRAMGPDSALGFGDPEDGYLPYKIRGAPSNMARYYVYYNYTTGEAKRWYDRELRIGFDNNRVTIAEPWHTPEELTYRSAYTDRFHMACATMEIAGRRTVCEIIAQYEEFGVQFHSVIHPDTLLLEEFNTIACRIDALFVARLELSEQPINCDDDVSDQEGSALLESPNLPGRL